MAYRIVITFSDHVKLNKACDIFDIFVRRLTKIGLIGVKEAGLYQNETHEEILHLGHTYHTQRKVDEFNEEFVAEQEKKANAITNAINRAKAIVEEDDNEPVVN